MANDSNAVEVLDSQVVLPYVIVPCGYCGYDACECHEIMKDAARVSPRWHYDHGGKRYIVYSPDAATAMIAASDRHGETILTVTASGHYDYSTNNIVGALDGPTVIEDNQYEFAKRRKVVK